MSHLIDLDVAFSMHLIGQFDSAHVKCDVQTRPKELFNFTTSHTHFLFNGCFYDQVDGVAMGSPLAPVLANFFMDHYEKVWLNNYTNSKVLYYRRYVDDIICCFKNWNDGRLFF